MGIICTPLVGTGLTNLPNIRGGLVAPLAPPVPKYVAQSAWDIPYLNRFLLNSFIVKSDNEIGKVNDKKNMI